MVIFGAWYNIDRKGLALKGKYGYGNPTNDKSVKKKKKKKKCNVELKSYSKSITKSGPKMYPCVYKSRD